MTQLSPSTVGGASARIRPDPLASTEIKGHSFPPLRFFPRSNTAKIKGKNPPPPASSGATAARLEAAAGSRNATRSVQRSHQNPLAPRHMSEQERLHYLIPAGREAPPLKSEASAVCPPLPGTGSQTCVGAVRPGGRGPTAVPSSLAVTCAAACLRRPHACAAR